MNPPVRLHRSLCPSPTSHDGKFFPENMDPIVSVLLFNLGGMPSRPRLRCWDAGSLARVLARLHRAAAAVLMIGSTSRRRGSYVALVVALEAGCWSLVRWTRCMLDHEGFDTWSGSERRF
jgi:hypothetical protein